MSIGEALARARNRAGLTVSEVSRRTRIRETVVRNIESDDFTACGGDFYSRGHIRAIAKVVGTDPAPLISEYDRTHRAPHTMRLTELFAASPGTPVTPGAPVTPRARPTSDTPALPEMPVPEMPATAVTPAETRARHRPNQTAAVALGLAVLLALLIPLGVLSYRFVAGPRHASRAAPLAQTHPVIHRHQVRPSRAARSAAAHPSVQPRMLTPVSVAAFGSGGAGGGDNPESARLAIDRDPATAWHTDWYSTARFGNLYPGTGLLLDMGRPVEITNAWIALGQSAGAAFQLRAGPAPSLADLKPVARAADAGGSVWLRVTTPARGRYWLIWFTSLPPDPAGTFQVSVHEVRLEGLG